MKVYNIPKSLNLYRALNLSNYKANLLWGKQRQIVHALADDSLSNDATYSKLLFVFTLPFLICIFIY